MEKLEIIRVGQTKQVQTKFGLKDKTGVIFKQYPDIWHDIWSKDLKVGQIVEGTRDSREWEGKTYWSFNFPKKEKGGVSQHDFDTLKQEVQDLKKKMDDLVIQCTGKVLTNKEYEDYTKPHPFQLDEAF